VVDHEATGLITDLLNRWQQGDSASFDELSKRIYSELHRIAESYLGRSSYDTLQPTALVNEAYIRLTGQSATYNGRKHFYALAAKVMRQVLVDRARARKAAKRGSGVEAESLDDVQPGESNRIEEFVILDEALTRLSLEEPRLAQIVELRYFGGLTGVEVGEMLDIPSWQVSREQRLAEAWLKRALSTK
jgi:RNA polymerase sigma-70 factor (ECF subfamily)